MPAGSSVLDIGSGGGLATSVLREAGFQVTPMDIQDGAYDDSTRPVVYDGKTFPFSDGQFDFGLLLTVLHHPRTRCGAVRSLPYLPYCADRGRHLP